MMFLGVCTDTVRKWRRRLAAARLAGLKDAPRSGRPPVFTAADRAEAVALACALPAESGVPLSRWSCPDLARELAAHCQIAVSASTIGRWLAADVLKPWQHRSWISVRDPAFAANAARVLDLYAGIWDGQPLGSNDYVICADEKTSIQARCCCHPTLPPGKTRAMRIEHDYKRHGGRGLPGRLGRPPRPGHRAVRAHHRHRPVRPAGGAGHDRRALHPRGPGVLDRGQRVLLPRRRLDQTDGQAWPNAHLIHLPVHASWLGQAEIYFSVIQHKVVSPNDFTSLDQIRDRLAAFETRYNTIARPFNWKFTRTDLDDLLHRIDTHDNTQAHALAA